MRLMLAPMEGVLDFWVRDLLTQINPYDICVTEFVRVVDMLLPEHVFYRLCPELMNNGKTRSGTPVRVQILGREPEWMAENARRAVELGSPGCDINFGCPANGVNRKNGGAALLQEPDVIYEVVRAVRSAVPDAQPVSAKIRLGWDSTQQSLEIADAVQSAGATELAVHGRTKTDGYKAEAIKWPAIGEICKRLSIPVTANGEIWNYVDGQRCIEVTGTHRLMVGRGALSTPNLGAVVKHNAPALEWSGVLQLLRAYLDFNVAGSPDIYLPRRIKQWMSYLRKPYPEAPIMFERLKKITTRDHMRSFLDQEIQQPHCLPLQKYRN